MTVWPVPKLRNEMLEFLGPILGSLGLISDKKKKVLVCLICVLYLCVIA